MIKKVKIEIDDIGKVKVLFEGEHITKRILMRVIKSLKLEHRRTILEFRKMSIKKKLLNNEKEIKDGRINEQKSREREQERSVNESDAREDKSIDSNVRVPESGVVSKIGTSASR